MNNEGENKDTKTFVDNLLILKMSEYTTPSFTQKRGRDWIKFGERNDYPAYIIKCFEQSTTHQAIINGKVEYIVGEGWNLQFKPNPYDSAFEFTKKLALDLELHNGFYIDCLPLYDGSTRYEHIPWQNIRTNKEANTFYYSKGWDTSNPEKPEFDYKILPSYQSQPNQHSIFYYRAYSPKISAIDVYPLPNYSAALPYIEIDYEIGQFHLNNLKNSFMGSLIVNFYNGTPSEEEKAYIEARWNRKGAGTSNTGRTLLNWNRSKEEGADVIPLQPARLDLMFDILNKTLDQKIIIGHKVVSGMLFGLQTEGKLGGRNEMLEAYELFKNTYVKGRAQILENTINFLLTKNVDSNVYQLKEKLPILRELQISDMQGIFTPGEIRAMLIKRYGLDIPLESNTRYT